MFIRLITMVVVPLVIASVFVGVASLGDIRIARPRRRRRRSIYFLGTTLVAALIGLARRDDGERRRGRWLVDSESGRATARAGATLPRLPGVVQTLINLVPQNPFAAAAQGGPICCR